MQAVSLFSLIALIAAAPDSIARSGDYFCGPRTAHFVARWYSSDVELLDVIREVQGDNSEGGTGVLDIKKYLENRGIGACIISKSRPTIENWKYPVILHLKPQSGALGHFVVLLPPEGSQVVTVWDGLNSFKKMTRVQLSNEMSGTVLVTAPSPTGQIEDLVASESTNHMAIAIGAVVVIGAGLFWWRF